jgi:predicted Zn-dependent peptidase
LELDAKPAGKWARALPLAGCLLLCGPAAARGAPLKIAHQQFRLQNGLNVILHPDPRLPRVVVNVLYRVGSRNDPPGLSGVAHLFEHLMFMGTARVPEGKIDLIMERAGGWNNAYTSRDFTVYYDVGPARLLATLLWIEADRMATLARALDRKKLDLQREVVINELRQSYDNKPYGKARLLLPRLMYPAGHPYGWPVIGSVKDIRQVTVRDVRRLFKSFYSPRNATLVVAGQLDPARTRRLVQRYFGWIPAAAPPSRATPEAPRLRRQKRRRLRDRVQLTKLILAWHSPALMQPGDAEMDLAAEILADGKQSRLYKALVYEQRLALQVEAYQESRLLGSQFVVEVTARAGVDPDRLLRATDEVLAKMAAAPPTARELRRAQTGYETQYVLRLERLQNRADLLNLYFALLGQPDFVEGDLQRYRDVTPAAVHRFCRKLLDPGRRVLLVVEPEAEAQPRPRAQTAGEATSFDDTVGDALKAQDAKIGVAY